MPILLRLLSILFSLTLNVYAAHPKPDTSQYNAVTKYINTHWQTLTRDITKCGTFGDPKMSGLSSLHFPSNFVIPETIKRTQEKCSIKISYLPKSLIEMIHSGHDLKNPDGLLYLPNPYIVPGGMFNEMYGWDSYFIIRGLIEDNQFKLAKGMVENFFFEIENYGSTLNGNRVYYLSRSQPPFLSSMVLSVYNASKEKQDLKYQWLKNAYKYIIKDYQFWTRSPHLAGDTQLSRYFDFKNGPVAETKNDINLYYRRAIEYFMSHPDQAPDMLAHKDQAQLLGNLYTIQVCDSNSPISNKTCDKIENVGLTKKFYQGDRAIRESGMDISFRFGPFGSHTIDYAPIDLNSLLYKTERDLEFICHEIGKDKEARYWHTRSALRGKKINAYFWNSAKGLFYDFNFRKNKQSEYDYIATFYPLWIGLATPAQALAVKNNLSLFEKKGGLATSTYRSGAQWDYPYGWAPFHLIAIEGLRRYGYGKDADRIANAFLANITENFHRDHTIREKYNVVTSSSNTKIQVGYNSNEIGFGWTNGVFLTLLHQLQK